MNNICVFAEMKHMMFYLWWIGDRKWPFISCQGNRYVVAWSFFITLNKLIKTDSV